MTATTRRPRAFQKNMPPERPQRYVSVNAISSRLKMPGSLLAEAMKRCRVHGKQTMNFRGTITHIAISPYGEPTRPHSEHEPGTQYAAPVAAASSNTTVRRDETPRRTRARPAEAPSSSQSSRDSEKPTKTAVSARRNQVANASAHRSANDVRRAALSDRDDAVATQQHAESEQRRAEAAQQHAESEQRRAEAAQQHAESEQRCAEADASAAILAAGDEARARVSAALLQADQRVLHAENHARSVPRLDILLSLVLATRSISLSISQMRESQFLSSARGHPPLETEHLSFFVPSPRIPFFVAPLNKIK